MTDKRQEQALQQQQQQIQQQQAYLQDKEHRQLLADASDEPLSLAPKPKVFAKIPPGYD